MLKQVQTGCDVFVQPLVCNLELRTCNCSSKDGSMIRDWQRRTVLRIEMLKQVHDASLDSLNDLDLPTSILKPLTPAFALTTHNCSSSSKDGS